MNIDSGRVYLALRSDGLGSRLKAMMNAMVLAEVTGGHFAFQWRNLPPVDTPFHAVLRHDEMFDPAFLAAHYRPDLKEEILPLKAKVEDILRGRPGEGEIVRIDQNVFDYDLLKASSLFDISGKFTKAFRNIRFAQDLERARHLAESVDLPPGQVALHLRAGDIMYGRHRFAGRYARKLYPYPLAIQVVEDCVAGGVRPLIFGQDADFKNWLKEIYGIREASDFLGATTFSAAQLALFEICLMARCKGIYAGSSCFPAVAAAISEQKVILPRSFRDRATRLVIMDHWLASVPAEPRISELQRAMAAWATIDLAGSLLSSEEQLLRADRALGHDPVNFVYALHGAHILYRLGRGEEAEERILGQLGEGSDALSHFMEHMKKRPQNSKASASPYLETFRRAAADGRPLAAFCVSLAAQALGNAAEARDHAEMARDLLPPSLGYLIEALAPSLAKAGTVAADRP